MKNILTFIAVLIVAGCASSPSKIDITSNVKPISVPIMYSPAPPVVARPDLPHLTISPDNEKIDGEVVKAYAGSIEALIGYSEQLEDIIAQYKVVHDSYATLATQVAADWKAKTGTDLVIPTEPDTVITAKPIPAPALTIVH